MIGAGITDRIATALSYNVESDEFFSQKGDELRIGLFVNILDKSMFDLDFNASVCKEGCLNFGTEITFDFTKTGIQLSMGQSIENRGDPKDERTGAFETAPLVYYMVRENMQLLAGMDFALPFNADPDAKSFEVGGAGLGFNVGLSHTVELITEINIDIPQTGEKSSVGFMVGYIATIRGQKK